jgi:hypothetical protein
MHDIACLGEPATPSMRPITALADIVIVALPLCRCQKQREFVPCLLTKVRPRNFGITTGHVYSFDFYENVGMVERCTPASRTGTQLSSFLLRPS